MPRFTSSSPLHRLPSSAGRRAHLVRCISAAALGPVLIGIGACGGGGDISKEKFAAEIRSEAGLTDEQSTCVVDAVYSEFEQDDINDLYSANEADDMGDGVYEKFTGLIVDCATGGS